MYQFGDIILVEFPYSDNSVSKKRPALVLLDTQDDDVLVVRITTQIHNSEYDITINDWQTAGLLASSCVRLHKVATLSKQLIYKKLGGLTTKDSENVLRVLQNIINDMK